MADVGTLVSPIEGLKPRTAEAYDMTLHVGTLVSPIEGLKHGNLNMMPWLR